MFASSLITEGSERRLDNFLALMLRQFSKRNLKIKERQFTLNNIKEKLYFPIRSNLNNIK
jgi:hypothetical protein